jgi:hypothetical protein
MVFTTKDAKDAKEDGRPINFDGRMLGVGS